MRSPQEIAFQVKLIAHLEKRAAENEPSSRAMLAMAKAKKARDDASNDKGE